MVGLGARPVLDERGDAAGKDLAILSLNSVGDTARSNPHGHRRQSPRHTRRSGGRADAQRRATPQQRDAA